MLFYLSEARATRAFAGRAKLNVSEKTEYQYFARRNPFTDHVCSAPFFPGFIGLAMCGKRLYAELEPNAARFDLLRGDEALRAPRVGDWRIFVFGRNLRVFDDGNSCRAGYAEGRDRGSFPL
jgi:hypothetical protein